VQVDYTLSLEDFYQSSRLWMRNKGLLARIWLVILTKALILGFVLLLVWIGNAVTNFLPASWNTFFLIWGIWLIVVSLISKRTMKKRYGMQKLDVPFKLRADYEGIEISKGDSFTRYGWKSFDKVVDSKDMTLLVVNKLVYIPIPKRALTSEQQSELRTLLAMHIPTK
jgi:YcxB-like protein